MVNGASSRVREAYCKAPPAASFAFAGIATAGAVAAMQCAPPSTNHGRGRVVPTKYLYKVIDPGQNVARRIPQAGSTRAAPQHRGRRVEETHDRR
eukprot:3697274-Pyramimonas_sp.AAC.1